MEIRLVLRVVVAAPLIAWALSSAVLANGWEWHSIPRAALIAGLESEEPAAKAYAIRALGFRNDRAVVPRLIEIAGSEDETADVRNEAVRALASIKDPRALEPLIMLMREGASPESRGGAAAALGQIGGIVALDAILDAFSEERGLLARIEMIGALGQFSDRRAVAALADELEEAESANLRRRAAIALGATRHRAATSALIEALGRPENQSFVGDLVDAMGRSGGGAARRPLAELAERADDLQLRTRATIALGSIEQGDVATALVKLLDDPRPAIRYHAIKGLAQQANGAAGPALVDSYHRIKSAQRQEDADILLAMTMRYEVVRALTVIDPVGSLDVLRDAAERVEYPRDSAISLRLNEGAYELRRAAIWGLGYSDSDDTVGFLIESALADRDFRIRSVAVRSLGVLGRRSAMPDLIGRLQDEAAEVRWQAALVLGRLGDPRASGALIAALDDPHPEVRRQAAFSLGYLGTKEAAPALESRAEEDDDTNVRKAARQALGLITK